MARPLRIEFSGATYHVTSRGDRREPIFENDGDRRMLLAVLGRAMERFDASVLAYCLMPNHYHLVMQTQEPNLSRVMRHINGVYTQTFNRRHGTVGHLFQGRFHAIVVDRDAYLLEVCRYVELNPVRAGLANSPADWRWSSYRAHAGFVPPAPWLDATTVLGRLIGRDVLSAADRREASQRYAGLVASAANVRLWEVGLRQQIYLGDDAFVERTQRRGESSIDSVEVPKPQRSKPVPLDQWLAVCSTREEALWRAHTESGISMSAMARALRLSVARVSQLIAKFEAASAPKT